MTGIPIRAAAVVVPGAASIVGPLVYGDAGHPSAAVAEHSPPEPVRALRPGVVLLPCTVTGSTSVPAAGVDLVEHRSQAQLEGPEVDQVAAAVDEIERLLGDTAQRQGRWSDLHRHLRFGQGHDWHDIAEFDWPSVRSDVEAGALAETDPLPVPDIDLGQAAAGRLTGTTTIALPWDRLDDDGFERLLYDLLRSFPEHENVQWLMQTRAPDRGRDLSLDRVRRDSTGGVRNERVIVQAKHWRSRSVRPAEVSDTLAVVKLWEPPVIRGLVIATTGWFTADAVSWTEKHNDTGAAPFIELWPDSRLETLLAQKPHLAAGHGLR